MKAHVANAVAARSRRKSSHETPRYDFVVVPEKGPKRGGEGGSTILEKVMEAPTMQRISKVSPKAFKLKNAV